LCTGKFCATDLKLEGFLCNLSQNEVKKSTNKKDGTKGEGEKHIKLHGSHLEIRREIKQAWRRHLLIKSGAMIANPC